MQPAVFFDRDGTLMEEVGYCADPEQVQLLPGAQDALLALRKVGYLLIMVSNQSGIGRGYLTVDQYRQVQLKFERELLPAKLDAVYFCPDPPDHPSDCRKPHPGMIRRAAQDFPIDLRRSFLIGDRTSDIECGRAAGCKTILVETGYGKDHQASNPDFVALDLTAAVRWITASRSSQP